MTNSEKIAMLKVMADESNEETLSTYLFISKQIVLNRVYPFGWNNEDVPQQYAANQLRIAQYLLNKRGAEGETSHTENGISRTYSSADIPYALLRDVVPYVKGVGI